MKPQSNNNISEYRIPPPPCLLHTLCKVTLWLLLIAMTVIIVSVFTFGAFSLYSGELVAPRHLPTELRVITLMVNTFASLIFLTLAIRGIYPDPNHP